jgi:hypothetical protein
MYSSLKLPGCSSPNLVAFHSMHSHLIFSRLLETPLVYSILPSLNSVLQFLPELSLTFFFILGSIGAWTQGLHLEPLHQPFFDDGFFQDRVSQTISPGWLWTVILLISASWVATITCAHCLWLHLSKITGLHLGLPSSLHSLIYISR